MDKMFFRGVDSGFGNRLKLVELSYLFNDYIDAKFSTYEKDNYDYYYKINAIAT
jgi:hypothetical protein